MTKDIYWICVFEIDPAKFDDFRSVVRPLIDDTQKEAGNLAYEYFVTKDRSAIHIIEHYRDSSAVV
jgi:quinol monooxygenase YgiN